MWEVLGRSKVWKTVNQSKDNNSGQWLPCRAYYVHIYLETMRVSYVQPNHDLPVDLVENHHHQTYEQKHEERFY